MNKPEDMLTEISLGTKVQILYDITYMVCIENGQILDRTWLPWAVGVREQSYI